MIYRKRGAMGTWCGAGHGAGCSPWAPGASGAMGDPHSWDQLRLPGKSAPHQAGGDGTGAHRALGSLCPLGFPEQRQHHGSK